MLTVQSAFQLSYGPFSLFKEKIDGTRLLFIKILYYFHGLFNLILIHI